MNKLAFLFAFICLLLLTLDRFKQRRRRLPPGPKGLPFVGAIREHPTKFQWLTYMKWGRDYGSDIVYYTVLGQPILVLNSAKAVNDLLQKRSAIYSDRPQSVMLNSVGWEKNLTFLGYGDLWRQHRRMFREYFDSGVISQHHSCLSRETKKLLRQILETPDNFMRHIQRLTGSVILEVTYGIEIKLQNDPYIVLAEKSLKSFIAAGNVVTYAVDIIPWLRYLPTWFPGVQFKRHAEEWKNSVDKLYEEPLQAVKDDLGGSKVSIAASMLSELDESQDNTDIECLIRNVTGTAYAGGAGTNVSTLWSFVLAMVLYPEVQKAAQAEIDRIMGQDRLPELEDRKLLPYITAVMRETFRWRPVGPLAIAHRLMSQDEYNGYYIPEGTIVIGNVWAILHDENAFPNPETFDPTRHLTPDGRLDAIDRSETVFGFAQILATFDISKAVDEHGRVLEPSGEYTAGTTVRPAPFPASFKPRSAAAKALIESPNLLG